MLDLSGLPGEALVREGIADAERRVWSVAALALAAAATRVRALGLPLPDARELPEEPELALYAALGADEAVDDAYGRYNAILGELCSFLDAAEARARRRSA